MLRSIVCFSFMAAIIVAKSRAELPLPPVNENQTASANGGLFESVPINARASDGFENGKSYKLKFSAQCCCGGGEDFTPDLYIKVWEKKNGGAWGKQWESDYKNDKCNRVWDYNIKYEEGIKKEMQLQLWAWDDDVGPDKYDDRMLETAVFEPFSSREQSLVLHLTEESKKCPGSGIGRPECKGKSCAMKCTVS